MAGSLILVKANGAPTQLGGAPLSGMTIYNQDSSNAIWIGDSPGVKPQAGIRLGPLGSLEWSKDKKLAYACVDTGVTSDILVNVSNDITNLQLPVDVATATALALFNQGVPNVFTNRLILFAALGNDLAPGAHVDLDIHSFASINIQMVSTGNVAYPVLKLDFYQENTAGNSAPITEYLTSIDPSTQYEFSIPVMSGSVRITNTTANPIAVVVYGSNRQGFGATILGHTYLPRVLNCNATWVAGTSQVLTGADGGPNFTTYNRDNWLSFTPGTGVSGQLYMQFIDQTGGVRSIQITNTIAASANTQMVVPHPLAVVRWIMLPQSSGASIATLSMGQDILT